MPLAQMNFKQARLLTAGRTKRAVSWILSGNLSFKAKLKWGISPLCKGHSITKAEVQLTLIFAVGVKSTEENRNVPWPSDYLSIKDPQLLSKRAEKGPKFYSIPWELIQFPSSASSGNARIKGILSSQLVTYEGEQAPLPCPPNSFGHVVSFWPVAK